MKEKKIRSKQSVEINVTYHRSAYTETDKILAEALKEIFEAFEADYQTNKK